MFRSLAIGALSFPFSLLALIIGWAAGDLRTGLLAGAAVFTCFFVAAVVNLFFIKEFSYLDAALPLVFAMFWSAALAPFSFGISLFSAPAFMGAALMLGVCMALDKRYLMDKKWLILPALVFFYEMLPINIPGPVDDTFALGGSVSVVFIQFLRRAVPQMIRNGIKNNFRQD